MPEKKGIDPGPIGITVARNLDRLCRDHRISYAELSRRLKELGRPIAPLGLTRIRDLQRRVDVDDLVALALALEVSPIELLLPLEGSPTQELAVTDAGPRYTHQQIHSWLMGQSSIDAEPLAPSMGDIRLFIRRRGQPPIELLPTTDEEEVRRALAKLGERPSDGDD